MVGNSEKHLGILDLLRLQGLDTSKRFKLVRHRDANLDLDDFLRRGWLQTYQAFQTRPVFDGLDYIVSFVGVAGTGARLEGVYEVGVRRMAQAIKLPPGVPRASWNQADYYYELRRMPGFQELEHRVVVEWGGGTRSWVQRPTNKRVTEILPLGQRLALFTDYLGFTVTHSELRFLQQHAEANREWRARLTAVAGIYLVLATTTGEQYVGSAYGVQGFWGRWSAYAYDGHGGNKLLRDLIKKDPAYPDSFSYSILQVLPLTTTRAEVLEWERSHKRKLGSRATGLNAN